MIKRLKNLWEISGYEIAEPESAKNKKLNIGDKITTLIKRKKTATIVDMNSPIDLFPEEKEI